MRGISTILLGGLLFVWASHPAAAQSLHVTDSLGAGDATIPGTRIFRDDPPTTCAQSTNCTPVSAGPFYYKSYTLTNGTASLECVSVTVTANCSSNSVQVAAYLGSFDPNNTCGPGDNYIGDSGNTLTDGVPKTFSFPVAAGQTFVIVANGTAANGGCQSYTLDVTAGTTPVELTRFDAD